MKADGQLLEIDVDLLQPGQFQPRKRFFSMTLEELADSIRQEGVVQPLVVRRIGDIGQRYEIIAGERRWRAAQIAGLHSVPCVVREVTDLSAAKQALIENVQREPLSPMEESRALARLRDEFGMRQSDIAAAVGKDRATVAHLMRLAELEPEVQSMLDSRQLDVGHAKSLVALPRHDQISLARQAVRQRWSVRQIELAAGKLRQPADQRAARDADVERLERLIQERMLARTELAHNVRTNSGRIVLHYGSLEELDGLLERMSISVNEN